MKSPVILGAALCLAAGFSFDAAAAAKGKAAAAGESRTEFQAERAQCDRRSTEDLVACRREAGAALQASRHGELDDHGANFEQNRLARCSYLKGGDQQDCERRMRGEGTASGSVEAGGIYRELHTTVPVEEGSSTGRSSIAPGSTR